MSSVTEQARKGEDTPMLRKARGAFFTPAPLCDYVVNWAIRDSNDKVLEPSCGDAQFLLSAAERLSRLGGSTGAALHGVELHHASAAAAKARLQRHGSDADIRVSDFFDVVPTPTYDAVVGNPPYVRYQDFAGSARSRSRAAALRAGVALTGLASSWAAFTVHAAMFLKQGGRLGLVLPAELLSVNYAADVRRFLMENFGHVRLVLFNERIFPGVLEEVVLLLADGYGEGPVAHCELYQARNVAELSSAVVGRGAPGEPHHQMTSSLLSSFAHDAVAIATEHDGFTTLESWGDTTLGMVTGNNGYFAMSPEDARQRGLRPGELLRLSPPGSRHLRNLSLSRAAWGSLGEAGAGTYLFRPPAEPSMAARRYIAAGEAVRVERAYKCRVRSPWWRVPVGAPPHLFLTYMNADTPRLCANRAGVHHLNSVHGVYLRPGNIRIGQDLLPIAALNSMSMLGAETIGRAYGGGMLKVEPREADRLPMPTPSLVQSARGDLRARRPELQRALALKDVGAISEIVDDILLVRHLGMRLDQVQALRDARLAMHDRRASRGADPESNR
jgi:adenine-specific DNA-methyltransferase